MSSDPSESAFRPRCAQMHTKPAAPEDAELVYSIKFAAYADYAIRARGFWDETFQRAYTKKNLPHTRLIYKGGRNYRLDRLGGK